MTGVLEIMRRAVICLELADRSRSEMSRRIWRAEAINILREALA